ncbi:hypothetical protein QAD02_005092 [Eretmocerus hayati]|uniref:Uncharacterized protein n=1 Tax=Eretmocerus hayati TaxID=131215 RepID=A0ACC2NWA5_9HYME|nr:hypothetical protein QAD02_005092 [Eretmocerus hayati]
MVNKEELIEKFQITGCENLDNDVLEKCVELCHLFNVDEEEFVEMWVAFGVGHLDGDLEPTLKGLEEMKRVTRKKVTKEHDSTFEKHQNHNSNFMDTSGVADDDEADILGIYATSGNVPVMRAKKPKSPVAKIDNESGGKSMIVEAECYTIPDTAADTSFSMTESPATQTSTLSSTQKSTQGTKVLISVGPKVTSWTNEEKQKCALRIAGPHVPSNARYMFELLKTTSDVRTRACRTIGSHMLAKWTKQKNDDVLITWNVRTRQQESYRTWGRVCFESETKQANPTILLEGCRKPPRTNNTDPKLWPQVELDVGDLRECCVFPGQILAVEGTNVTESLIKVNTIFNSSFIPAAKSPQLSHDLQIVVAAGPFTPRDNLSYQPLWELLSQVVEEEPHILILIGPFLDHTHPHIQNDSLNCTYQTYFYDLINKIKKNISGKCTQVVLVASSQDVHHHSVFPTPEYFLPKAVQSPDIHVVPDPCILDIDGLRLAVTSVDSLKHLGREEVTLKPSGTDKLSRLATYVLNQACFYPLYPPAKEINIDTELWEKYAFIREKPHVLILPSDMRYLCKNINDCTIVNPERLSKRTFAKMNFKPAVDGLWTGENNVSCEIIKM